MKKKEGLENVVKLVETRLGHNRDAGIFKNTVSDVLSLGDCISDENILSLCKYAERILPVSMSTGDTATEDIISQLKMLSSDDIVDIVKDVEDTPEVVEETTTIEEETVEDEPIVEKKKKVYKKKVTKKETVEDENKLEDNTLDND